jgi:hypothetical protein
MVTEPTILNFFSVPSFLHWSMCHARSQRNSVTPPVNSLSGWPSWGGVGPRRDCNATTCATAVLALGRMNQSTACCSDVHSVGRYGIASFVLLQVSSISHHLPTPLWTHGDFQVARGCTRTSGKVLTRSLSWCAG